MFPKIVGCPPKSSILIGFSMIFTIHFGVPLFLETAIQHKYYHQSGLPWPSRHHRIMLARHHNGHKRGSRSRWEQRLDQIMAWWKVVLIVNCKGYRWTCICYVSVYYIVGILCRSPRFETYPLPASFLSMCFCFVVFLRRLFCYVWNLYINP